MSWMLLMLLAGPAQAEDHSVVVTDDVKVQPINKKSIRRLFTGQEGQWEDGRPVNLILPPMDSEAMSWLSAQVLGLPPDIYHRYLLEKAYRAGRSPPQIAGSIEDLLELAGGSELVLTVLPLPVGDGFQVVQIN
jgi:hypothetical protein